MINFLKNNEAILIPLEEKLDSTNVNDIEKEIYDYINALDDEFKSSMTVFFDLDKLDYISSAGLRLLLKVKKEYAKLKVINVHENAYNIFDTTGFTGILTVRKPIQEIKIDNFEYIGEGVTAKVYKIDNDKIIKLYNKGLSLYEIYKETDNAHAAFSFGVPTAITYDIVTVDGCYGVIYELLDSKCVYEAIACDKENMDKYITEFATMLRESHSIELDNTFKDAKQIDLSLLNKIPEQYSNEKELIKAIYDKIPESNNFCHGDAHLKNVLYQNGEILFIDMASIAKGHASLDFNSLYSMFVFTVNTPEAAIKPIDSRFTNEEKTHIFDKILKVYFQTEDEEKIKDYTNQIKMVSFAKLCLCMLTMYSELVPENTKRLFLNELHKFNKDNLLDITF